ncbi:MAG: STAS domain-containing protein [Phycisphaerae bacterium]|nr:STAS domain-containing protein [Phycisphaerae bacterium]
MGQRNPRMNVTDEGNVTIVELTDKKILEEVNINEIGRELSALAARSDKPRLILNFAPVSHMSSSALGMLITLHKRIREKKGQLKLCNIQPAIYEVFVITRLNEIFDIYQSQAKAMESFN